MAGGRLHARPGPSRGGPHATYRAIPGDTFPGACKYHGDCWEGLCSGEAIRQRTGMAAEELPPDHPAWDYETQYIGYAIANMICTLSPRRVIVGGSVSKGGQLGEDAFFGRIRGHVQTALNGYVVAPALLGDGIRELHRSPATWETTRACAARSPWVNVPLPGRPSLCRRSGRFG